MRSQKVRNKVNREIEVKLDELSERGKKKIHI